jgi:hypothetical protein
MAEAMDAALVAALPRQKRMRQTALNPGVARNARGLGRHLRPWSTAARQSLRHTVARAPVPSRFKGCRDRRRSPTGGRGMRTPYPLPEPSAPRLRGLDASYAFLDADGGIYSAKDVCRRCGVSMPTVVKWRKAGRIVSVDLPKRGHVYPAWQFQDDGMAIAGLLEVLEVLKHHPPLARARFFVDNDPSGGVARPLDRLRGGEVIVVLALARAFREEGRAL